MLVDLAAGEEPERVALYIDAEDPDRSSWTRYVNHAETADSCCNLKLQTAAAPVACAWLVASREIEPGEELHFDYGPCYSLPRSDVMDAWHCECAGHVCLLGCECV